MDGDRKPSMPWLYGELRKAKQDIREALNNVENSYQPIIEIIEGKMKDRLDSSLHMTAFLLNPYYHYKDPKLSLESELMEALIECLETFYHDNLSSQHQIIMHEWPKYKIKDGAFGKPLAVKGCEDDSTDSGKKLNVLIRINLELFYLFINYYYRLYF